MSLVSADEILIPLQTEFFALEGISQLVKTIDRIKVKLNPALGIRGVLLTMFDKRNKLSLQVDSEARKHFKDKVYKTVVPRNVRLSEAPSHGMPCLIMIKNVLVVSLTLIWQRNLLIKSTNQWVVLHESRKKGPWQRSFSFIWRH